jgi:hypothetical protein
VYLGAGATWGRLRFTICLESIFYTWMGENIFSRLPSIWPAGRVNFFLAAGDKKYFVFFSLFIQIFSFPYLLK